MVANNNELNSSEFINRLNDLEKRIAQLEATFKIKVEPTHPQEEEEIPESIQQIRSLTFGSLFESSFGESGLAWIGNLVLFLGIVFLVEHLQKLGFQLFAPILGYIAVAGIFLLSYYLKGNYPRMAKIFNLNAYLLLFYVTLILHYFSETPVIDNYIVGRVLVTLVPVVQLFIALKNKSATLTGFSLLLFGAVAVISYTTHFMLTMSVIIAAIAVITLFRYGWIRLMYLAVFISYLVNLLWFMNNPFLSHQLQAVHEHQNGFIYLFVIGFLFSLTALIKGSEKITSGGIVSVIVMNGLGFSMLLLLFILTFFLHNYIWMVGSISAFCLLYSVLLQIKSEWKIIAALYALYGFVTLSAAIHGIYAFPRAYFLLAIQSLLVVTMAIWFRSRFIVIMNTLLFIILLIFYLMSSELINGVNISFSFAALLTARILNWKKDHLTIKTDLLRNAYLVMTFIMVLITLYHLAPARYVTLTWTAAALGYFMLSLLLRNVKYRYLALGTMLAATFYLFIIDLARIELVFRILAFMFLAIISIGLSIYYSRRSKRKIDSSDE